MYLLYDNKPSLPISYFGLSIIVHGVVVVAAMIIAMKMAQLSPLKKQVIEIEISSGIIQKPLVKNSGPKSTQIKHEHKEVVKDTPDDPDVSNDPFVANENFDKLELKGSAWSEDSKLGSAPELQAHDDSAESYEALTEKYKSTDIDSDLDEAGKKNEATARQQAQKIKDAINSDAKALSAYVDKAIKVKANSKVVGNGDSGSNNSSKMSKGSKGSKSSSNNSVSSGNSTSPSVEGVHGGGSGQTSNVRALRDLRQMPGNKKPDYSIEDRRANKQGDVIYHAFINSEGKPDRFILIKSSGYRSLDQSTLLALRKWRFYSGQEGWVELPFHWSIKGGAVEAPSLLRR
jgi:TonB family protein